jgi:hypothetical protein
MRLHHFGFGRFAVFGFPSLERVLSGFVLGFSAHFFKPNVVFISYHSALPSFVPNKLIRKKTSEKNIFIARQF